TIQGSSRGVRHHRDAVLREVEGTGRDGHHKLAAAAFLALRLNGSAMQFHQLLHQRQPDAGAFVAAPPTAFNALQAFKQTRPLSRGYSHAGVFNAEFRTAVCFLQPGGYFPRMRELERVGEQIQYDALPHLSVHIHRRPRLIAANLESEASPFDRGPEDACDFGGCFPELYRFVRSLNPSGLDSRKFKQRVDQLEQASGIAVNLLDLGEADRSW